VIKMLMEELRNPDLIVASYLSSQEEVYYDDPPAIQAFLFLNGWEVVLVVLLIVADAWFWVRGMAQMALLTFLVIDALVIVLIAQRFRELFTRYVITSSRIMRVSGVVSRRSMSIPWAKVTDLSFRQSLWMRYFGFANVRIESANEQSGLQELKGLKDPLKFHRLMLEMVAAKQGHTAPESGDPPLAKFEADSPIRQRARLMSNQPKPPVSSPRPHWTRTRGRRRRRVVDEGPPVDTINVDDVDDDAVLYD
jgi:membrane protein YdbS with pleckstrin-like domain